MRMYIRTGIVMLMMAVIAVGAFAGGSQEVDFIDELEVELQENGFTSEQAQAIAAAAREYDWSDGDTADAAIVAELVAEVNSEVELTSEEGAQLALAVARDAVTLSGNGHAETEVAEATLAAVEELQQQIRDWKDGDRSESLGETVRTTVSDGATEAARERSGRTESDDESDGDDEDADADDAPVESAGDAASDARNR